MTDGYVSLAARRRSALINDDDDGGVFLIDCVIIPGIAKLLCKSAVLTVDSQWCAVVVISRVGWTASRSGVKGDDAVPHGAARTEETLGETLVFDHGELEGIARELRGVVCVNGASHALEDDEIGVSSGDAHLVGETPEIEAGRARARADDAEGARFDGALDFIVQVGGGVENALEFGGGDVVDGW